MGRARARGYNRRMRSKIVPMAFVDLSWGMAIPQGVSVSTAGCSSLGLLLGGLLIVFALAAIARAWRLCRRPVWA